MFRFKKFSGSNKKVIFICSVGLLFRPAYVLSTWLPHLTIAKSKTYIFLADSFFFQEKVLKFVTLNFDFSRFDL